MEQEQINKLYMESEQCINAMTDKILRKNSLLDREEILSEANLIFCECVEKYEQKTGQFLNFLSTVLYFRLYQKCREMSGEKRNSKNEWEIREELMEDIMLPDQNYQNSEEIFVFPTNNRINDIVSATIANLSSDAQEMTHIIFNPPPELHNIVENNPRIRRITKKNLYEYLRKIGLQRKRILHSFWEIKSELHEVWV